MIGEASGTQGEWLGSPITAQQAWSDRTSAMVNSGQISSQDRARNVGPA